MECVLKGTGIMAFYLDLDPQAALKKKVGNFDEADLQKSYARAKGKDYETVAISSRSIHIGSKIQALTQTAPLIGFNIAPSE